MWHGEEGALTEEVLVAVLHVLRPRLLALEGRAVVTVAPSAAAELLSSLPSLEYRLGGVGVRSEEGRDEIRIDGLISGDPVVQARLGVSYALPAGVVSVG